MGGRGWCVCGGGAEREGEWRGVRGGEGRREGVRVFFSRQVGKSVLLLTFSKNVLVRLRCFFPLAW